VTAMVCYSHLGLICRQISSKKYFQLVEVVGPGASFPPPTPNGFSPAALFAIQTDVGRLLLRLRHDWAPQHVINTMYLTMVCASVSFTSLYRLMKNVRMTLFFACRSISTRASLSTESYLGSWYV
jgi:hypothetical protein